jgi:hypothetical protein
MERRSGAAFEAIGAFVEQTVNLTGAGAANAYRYTVTPGFGRFNQPIALGRSGDARRARTSASSCLAMRLGNRFAPIRDRRSRHRTQRRALARARRAAPTFRYPSDAQLWTPTFLPANRAGRGSNSLAPVARLAPGVTPEQARDVMRGITQWQAENFPNENGADRAGSTSRRPRRQPPARPVVGAAWRAASCC